MSRPSYLFVYADKRELDLDLINEQREGLVRDGHLKLLKTGVGKTRAALATSSYLTQRLHHRDPKPHVVSIGTCAIVAPDLEGMMGQMVRPRFATDRDATPDLLESANLTPQPVIELEDYDDLELTIGTGDGFVASPEQAAQIAARNIHLVDMETHAVAYAARQCLAGPALGVRFVTDVASRTDAAKDWAQALSQARQALTRYILDLTA